MRERKEEKAREKERKREQDSFYIYTIPDK